MKRVFSALIVLFAVVVLGTCCYADETSDIPLSSAQSLVDYYEVYLMQFCSDNDGWHYLSVRSDIEEGGSTVCFYLCKDNFFSDVSAFGVNDPSVKQTIDDVKQWSLELYGYLRPFEFNTGICLMKNMDEDSVCYLVINGEEYIPAYISVDQNYIYSGLVETIDPPGDLSSSNAIQYYESYLSDFCNANKGWQFTGINLSEGMNKVCFFMIAREGFEERLYTKGLSDPYVNETLRICNDFSHMISEGLFPYRVYISSVILTTYDGSNGVCYIAHDGREMDLLSKDAYTSIQLRYGNGGNNTGSDSPSFTNRYGSPITKCSHPGCNNTIASTGDTNCCSKHAHKCLNCGKYIDEDALYCMDCISNSLIRQAGTSNSTYSGEKRNGYDMPKSGESLPDYIKRVEPELYDSMLSQYETAQANGW